MGNGTQVVDAYPLFHTPIVNPTLSVALDLIESNLPEGQRIIGFYEFVEGSEPKINSIIESNPQMKDMIAMRVPLKTPRCGSTSRRKSNWGRRASTSKPRSGPPLRGGCRTASTASWWTSTRTSRRSSWTSEILIFNDLCYPSPQYSKSAQFAHALQEFSRLAHLEHHFLQVVIVLAQQVVPPAQLLALLRYNTAVV